MLNLVITWMRKPAQRLIGNAIMWSHVAELFSKWRRSSQAFFFHFIFSILVRLVFLIPNIIKAILFILDSDVVTIPSVKTQVTLWITSAQSTARRKPFNWILSGTLELKPTLWSMCIAILRCALQMLRILHVNARLWLIATLMLENGEQLKLMNLWCIASRLVLIITRR